MRDLRQGRTSLTHRLRRRFIVLASIPVGLGWLVFGNAAGVRASQTTIPTVNAICKTPPCTTGEGDTTTLTVVAENTNATEGAQFSGEVATWSDDDTAFTGNYSATITWGGGSTAAEAGTITLDADGHSGTVSGTHTYAEESGTTLTSKPNLTVKVFKGGTTSKSGSARQTIHDAAIHVTAKAATTTEGTDALVATFVDDNPNAQAGDFTVTVDCFKIIPLKPSIGRAARLHRASAPSSATSSTFEVRACNESDEGTGFPTEITVKDTDGGNSDTKQGTLDVTNAALTATKGADLNPGESGFVNQATLATFTDANPAPDSTDFTASINWGDGTTSEGSISGSGPYTVKGTRESYAEGGTYTITVSIVDQDTGTKDETAAKATATLTATVADAPLHATAKPASSTEGQSSGDVVVASFYDDHQELSASAYSASINWNDGSTSTGTVAVDATQLGPEDQTVYTVTGKHTYPEEGAHTAHVTIADNGGSSASVDSAITVKDAALSASNGQGFNAQQGQSTGNVVTATFTDAKPAKDKTDFTASINWGDSQTSTGTVSLADNGTFSVTGSHTYSSHGSFTVTTTITDTGGSTKSATAAASVAKTVTLAQTGGSWLLPPDAGPYALGGGLLLILGVLGWWAVLRDRFVWSSKRLR